MGISTIPSAVARQVLYKDQWCATPLASLVLPATGAAADLTFPSVVLPASFLPGDANISAINLILKWRWQTNTNVGANAICIADGRLRIMKTGAAWATDAIIALQFADNQLTMTGSTEAAGTEIIGSIDLQSEVDDIDNETYEIQSRETVHGEGIVVDGVIFTIYDVYTGLRVYYHLH